MPRRPTDHLVQPRHLLRIQSQATNQRLRQQLVKHRLWLLAIMRHPLCHPRRGPAQTTYLKRRQRPTPDLCRHLVLRHNLPVLCMATGNIGQPTPAAAHRLLIRQLHQSWQKPHSWPMPLVPESVASLSQ